MGWGTLRIGRMEVSEGYRASEQHNAGTRERTLQIQGQAYTSWHGLDNDGVVRAQEDINGLADQIVAVRFENKAEFDGYYRVKDVGTDVLYWNGDGIRSFDWGFILHRYGPDNAVDIESRVGTVVRLNNFALLGERWHAPAGGAYGYHTGTSAPSGAVTRASADGNIIVYRGIPANVNPRWGCPVASYGIGRARVLVGGFERSGIGLRSGATEWEISNGIVRVSPLLSGGLLSVDAWNGSTWEAKAWHIARGGATTPIGDIDYMTVLRNDFEMATIRLMVSAAQGRAYVDLTLRRGSRFVEVLIQSDTSATLGAYLESTETASDQTASGYVVASGDDAAGNRFIVGSSKTVAYTTDRGISKAASVELDLYLGVVFDGSGAASGDAAADLRNQYIGAVSESTAVVTR